MITTTKKVEIEEFVNKFKQEFKALYDIEPQVIYDLTLPKVEIEDLLNIVNEVLWKNCPNEYKEGIRSKTRRQSLSEHRQVFFMMAREMGYSYSYLSSFIGYDHATAIYSYNKVIDMLKLNDKVITDIYQSIKIKLYDKQPIQDVGGESNIPKSDLSAL
jgi:hypothetical protein